MNEYQIRYHHIATENAPGKWQSIALVNQAKLLSKAQAKELFPIVVATLVAQLEKRVAKLATLKAPPIIMARYESALAKLKREDDMKKVHPCITPLKKLIKG